MDLKNILLIFQVILDLKVNFSKSSIVGNGAEEMEIGNYATNFSCIMDS